MVLSKLNSLPSFIYVSQYIFVELMREYMSKQSILHLLVKFSVVFCLYAFGKYHCIYL